MNCSSCRLARKPYTQSKELLATAEVYHLKAKPGTPLVVGQAVGEKIGTGSARVVSDVSKLQDGSSREKCSLRKTRTPTGNR